MKKEIYLAGGCFWGVQKYFDQFRGVLSTTVGYVAVSGTALGLQGTCSEIDLHLTATDSLPGLFHAHA